MGEARICDYQLPWTSEQILEKTRIIESVCQSSELILHIIKNYHLISVNVKDSRGALAFFILGTPDGFCYIFDVLICENMISHGGIKQLLECYDVVKVIIDIKYLYDVMQCFHVYPANVFDTQIAHQLIEGLRRNCSPSNIERVALCCISNMYGRELRVPNENDYRELERYRHNYLECRPLSCELAECFAREVLCLIPEAYVNMCLLIPSSKRNLLIHLIQKNVGLLPSDLSNGLFFRQKSFGLRELNPQEVESNGKLSPCISAFSNQCTNCINCQCRECQSEEKIKYIKRPSIINYNSKSFCSPLKVFNLGPTPWIWGYSPIRDDDQINYIPSCTPRPIGREILNNSHKNEINYSNHDKGKRGREEHDDDDRCSREYGSESGTNSMEVDDSDKKSNRSYSSHQSQQSQQSNSSERSSRRSHHRKHHENDDEHREHHEHRKHRDGHSDRRSRSSSHHSSEGKQSNHKKTEQNGGCLVM